MYPIPASATRLQCIEATGTQWIDTGCTVDMTTKIEARWYQVSFTTQQQRLYGIRENKVYFDLFVKAGKWQGRFFHSTSSVVTSITAGTIYTAVADADAGTITINGTTASINKGTGSPSTQYTLPIFARRVDGTPNAGYQAKMRLYYFRIWKSGEMVRDFVPVKVDNAGCLFDRVTGQFFYNKGTGSFVCWDGYSVFSHAVKHLSGTGTFLASRAMGDSSGTVKAVRKHYDMPMQYTIDECNGNAPTAVNVYFPSGTYDALDYTPTWSGHRFVGWYTTSATPSTTAPTSGTQVHKGDSVVFDRSTVYARWQLPTTVTFDATTNGGQMPSGWVSPDYYIGQVYGTLPQPTKSGEVFLGWFTSGGTRITESSTVTTGTLTARYAVVTYATRWEVVCSTTSRLKTGIYSATSRNSADPTVVDWGDGTYDVVYGNISQLVHTYASTGTRTVQVSDNISTFALSTSSTTFCQTTTSNYYNVHRVLAVSPNVTSIPAYAFYYLYYLYSVVFGGNGESLTLNSYAFYYTFRGGPASTLDLSGRTCTSIPAYFCYYCTYLKNFIWPRGVTSIGRSAFRNCFYYSASTGTIEIPEGVTSISGTYAFANCLYLTAVTLPSTLTSLNNYTFYYCTRLATITSNRSTAPTVSSATFGNGTTYYTGRTSYSAGTNRLYVPSGATGYNASYWASVLLDSTKCGFTLEEMP